MIETLSHIALSLLIAGGIVLILKQFDRLYWISYVKSCGKRKEKEGYLIEIDQEEIDNLIRMVRELSTSKEVYFIESLNGFQFVSSGVSFYIFSMNVSTIFTSTNLYTFEYSISDERKYHICELGKGKLSNLLKTLEEIKNASK